jgi:hypothetical protein
VVPCRLRPTTWVTLPLPLTPPGASLLRGPYLARRLGRVRCLGAQTRAWEPACVHVHMCMCMYSSPRPARTPPCPVIPLIPLHSKSTTVRVAPSVPSHPCWANSPTHTCMSHHPVHNIEGMEPEPTRVTMAPGPTCGTRRALACSGTSGTGITHTHTHLIRNVYLLSGEGSDRALQRVVGTVRGSCVAAPSLRAAETITVVSGVVVLLYDGSVPTHDRQYGH